MKKDFIVYYLAQTICGMLPFKWNQFTEKNKTNLIRFSFFLLWTFDLWLYCRNYFHLNTELDIRCSMHDLVSFHCKIRKLKEAEYRPPTPKLWWPWNMLKKEREKETLKSQCLCVFFLLLGYCSDVVQNGKRPRREKGS